MQTALITGGNSGIGRAAACELARRGWRVAITARSPQCGQEAIERIRRESDAEAELIALDLASFASVREAASDALARLDQIDVLINNAGVTLSRYELTGDGIETTMQVNHFGHFLLTSLLLPRLGEAPAPRIVNVSSSAHRRGALDFDDLNLERSRGAMRRYAASKLANVLFTRELHRRYGGGVSAFAVHPGTVRTGFGADGDVTGFPAFALRMVRPLLRNEADGAAPVVRLAAADDAPASAGRYFDRMQAAEPSKQATDEAAARLWDASCELTGAAWPETGASS